MSRGLRGSPVDNHEEVPRRSDSPPRSARARPPARAPSLRDPPKRSSELRTAPVPRTTDLAALRQAARACRACPLWERGTQTVFGEGPRQTAVLLVGEQPGNDEDLAGRPFVGPAGRLLDRALEAAGLDRASVYVTNAVKHFKWEARGKRRIHQKPNVGEVRACRPWLDAELRAVQPRAVVLLGATAAQALLGSDFRVTQRRGELLSTGFAPIVVATVHPSSILRAPDDETRREEMRRFVEDLARVAEVLRTSQSSRPTAP
ncbi:UdgX family uracil-DNA binding protein [Anaeromyxobacter sp. SG17]|uniref:UdgX family uracil-DNA binding protein n=1 Tax=Anaeromyxobacter sp. SG17 TaxID=2925405 RepID=UPI0027E061A0|nr:UdgX family uracil-DNA binding protein [Anaeromyxobacter sp. SG17]